MSLRTLLWKRTAEPTAVAAHTTVVHPELLSDEDGELYWLREDIAPTQAEAGVKLTAIIGESDDWLGSYFEACGLVPMRRATLDDVDRDEEGYGLAQWQVDQGWYLPCEEGEHDVRYWKWSA